MFNKILEEKIEKINLKKNFNNCLSCSQQLILFIEL